MLHVIGCIRHEHDVRLVAVACLLCCLGALTTVQMLGRAQAARGRMRLGWIAAGGVTFGCFVWTTHFIGMLAYRPDMPMRYDPSLTSLSLLVVICGGWAGLAIAIQQTKTACIAAGVLLGLAIGVMHFTGMAAVSLAGTLVFRPGYVVAAWGLGAFLGPLALLRFRAGQPLQAACGLILAVAGLHFTAMAAVSVLPDGTRIVTGATAELAIAVTAASLIVLLASLGGVAVDSYLEKRAARENQRFSSFANATFEGIFFLDGDIVSDTNGVLSDMIGRSGASLSGTHLVDHFASEDHQKLRAIRAGTLASAEMALLESAGGRRVVDVLARPLDATGMAVIAVRDASERKRAECRIHELAHTDLITGLANRLLLRDRLWQAVAIAERSASSVAVLRIDLDRFRQINEAHGQRAGDAVLAEAARRLQASVREIDTAARLDGNEFIIVQPFKPQPQSAELLAQHLMRSLGAPLNIKDFSAELTASIGIAIYPDDAADAEGLLRQADLALDRTKREGRSGYRFFEAVIDSKLRARRELEQDLRQALARQELRLVYQPIFEGDRLTITGYEALLRWQHPSRGAVGPDEFIPVAEECGAILRIGAWVLHTACAEATRWPEARTVAVNLSPAQFGRDDLIAQVRDTLARTGLAPGRLELEVTEGVLMGDTQRAGATLHGLRALGVRLALDDFGTGFSSLSYLRRFPFDRLKIDRSFIRELGTDADADAIVSCIMAMSRSLRLAVTAEGVETEMQLRLLRAMQCGHLQGYLLGRPLPAADISCVPAEATVPA